MIKDLTYHSEFIKLLKNKGVDKHPKFKGFVKEELKKYEAISLITELNGGACWRVML